MELSEIILTILLGWFWLGFAVFVCVSTTTSRDIIKIISTETISTGLKKVVPFGPLVWLWVLIVYLCSYR